MKQVYTVTAICCLLLSSPVFSGQAEYDDCILKYLKNAKLDSATHLIKQACEDNYKNPNFTSNKKRKFNNCLLENLPGIESQQAVIDINAACGNKYK